MRVVIDELSARGDEAGTAKAPQALVDVAAIRRQLLQFGWVKDARVSRRLPDTLVIDIVERTPAALWQNQGQLALIDNEGVVLDRVPVDKMPDLPLLIGPGANGQAQQLGRLMDSVPTLKPQLASATWVGGRRWDLNFQSGETVALARRRRRRRAAARANSPSSTNRPACSAAAWSASICASPARWSFACRERRASRSRRRRRRASERVAQPPTNRSSPRSTSARPRSAR